MRKKFFIFVLTILMVLPPSAFAKSDLEAVKIGDITDFSGEVLVRINGKWSALGKSPQPLYSSDKVATRRGRAKISLSDGSTLKMDTDSNISVSQSKKKGGLFSKRQVVSRQINVLIGNIWFDVRMRDKKGALTFRTPTMTATIKGTSGGINVAADGRTNGGLTRGEWMTEGGYDPLLASQIKNPDVNVSNQELPLSDPVIDTSQLQTLAKQSVQRTEAARRALEDADNRLADTKKQDDPVQLALAASAKAEASSATASADIISAQEVLEEAKRFGDEEVIARAEALLSGVMDISDMAAEAALEASRMADAALGAKTSEDKQIYASAAMAHGSAAEANANATHAAVNASEIATSDNDLGSVIAAQGEVEKAKTRAHQATTAARIAEIQSDSVATAPTESGKQAALAAAQANAAAAQANAAASRTNARVAEMLSTKDPRLVLEVQTAAGRAEENAIQADKSAHNASAHAKAAVTFNTEAEASANAIAAAANAAAANANAAAANANAAAANANANIAKAYASGNTEAAIAAREAVSNAENSASKTTTLAQNASKNADTATQAKTEAAAQAAAWAATANAAAATANAATAKANANVTAAQVSGNTDAATTAQVEASVAETRAKNATTAAQKTSAHAELAATAATEEEAWAAAQAAAKSAQTAMAAADGVMGQTDETQGGETPPTDEATGDETFKSMDDSLLEYDKPASGI